MPLDISVAALETNWLRILAAGSEYRCSDTCGQCFQLPASHGHAEFQQGIGVLHSWRVLVVGVPFRAISPLGGATWMRLYRLFFFPTTWTLPFSYLVSLRQSLARL